MYIQLYEYLNDFTCIIAFYNIFDQISWQINPFWFIRFLLIKFSIHIFEFSF